MRYERNRYERNRNRAVWFGPALAALLLAATGPAGALQLDGGGIFLDQGVEIVDDGPADFFMRFRVIAIAESITIAVNDPDMGCPTEYMLVEEPEMGSNFWLGGSAPGAFGTAADRDDCFPTGTDEYTITLEETGETPIAIDLDFLPPDAPNGTIDITTIDDVITPANMAMNVSLQPSFDWTESTCTNCRIVCDSGGATPQDPSNLEVSLFDDEDNFLARNQGLGHSDTDHTVSNVVAPLDEGATYKFSVRVFNRVLVTDLGASCPGTLDGFNVDYGMSRSRVDSVTFTTIPEPGGLLLVGAGLAGLVALRRRRLAH